MPKWRVREKAVKTLYSLSSDSLDALSSETARRTDEEVTRTWF